VELDAHENSIIQPGYDMLIMLIMLIYRSGG
jgi:hypothetical protein